MKMHVVLLTARHAESTTEVRFLCVWVDVVEIFSFSTWQLSVTINMQSVRELEGGVVGKGCNLIRSIPLRY